MPRSLSLFAGGAAAAFALVAVPACSAGIAESSASLNDFAQCLTDNGVPPAFATPPQGPAPDGQRRPPPVPDGVDAGTWNDAFAACADLAPPHPPGRGGPPPPA